MDPASFVYFDFNSPLEGLDPSLEHKFDMIVADPPFVTHDVWLKYKQTIDFLLKEGGKVLVSTIPENK
jgi:hypothetical protein